MRSGDVSIQAQLHTSGFWIMIPLVVRNKQALRMVLDTGAPVSAISPEIWDELQTRDLLRTAPSAGYHLISDITVDGQPMPDLAVRVLPRLSRIGVEGLLGLDYLGKFESVYFHIPTLRITLRRSGL
jgi:hypothetical protein